MAISDRIKLDDGGTVPSWELQDRLARAMRNVPGMTQADIADVLGVRRETVGRWMNGQNKPNRGSLRTWAQACGVSFHWLETGQAPPVEPEGPGLYAIRDSNPEPADSGFGRLQLVAA